MRIACLNNKGGVGKTLVTVYLAEALALRGKRVLVVDLDPQANATRRLGVRPADDSTLTRCLMMGVKNGDAATIHDDGLPRYVHPCGWTASFAAMIDVLPADLDLEDRALEAGQPGAHYRLRRALYGADDSYDFTLIDFPPSLKGHLTTLGIAALDTPGDRIVIPVHPGFDEITGAQRVIAYVEQYGADLGFAGEIGGVIVNGARGTNLHKERTAGLPTYLPGVPMLGSAIPLRAKAGERIDAGLPLTGEREVDEVRAVFDTIADDMIKASNARDLTTALA